MIKINLKEADNVIKAIEGGITPRRGIQHLLVGRNNEVQEIVKILDKITILRRIIQSPFLYLIGFIYFIT